MLSVSVNLFSNRNMNSTSVLYDRLQQSSWCSFWNAESSWSFKQQFQLFDFMWPSICGWPSVGGHKPGKPKILRDFSEHGKLREFCATSGKNCNEQSIFSSSFKYLCKTAVNWVNMIIRNRDEVRLWWWPVMLLGVDVEWPLMKVIITFTFCCNKHLKSKFMAVEKPGKLREFFSPTLWLPWSVILCGTDFFQVTINVRWLYTN